MKPGPYSLRALICAPNGRDAVLAREILREAGLASDIVLDLPGLCGEIEKGAGLAIIAEEAIASADLRALAASLRQQPPWSDFASIVLTQRSGTERTPAAARLGEILGNVAFLERPFHPTTLVSMVSGAVRSRRRQYDARARLEELARERAALAELTENLEQRVRERSADLLAESKARERAQEQLLQSQKMDTLGQLTGGVAHDFNNLLMAVLANLELLQKRVSGDAYATRLVEGAIQGARRGATLTQRMLAFARQQQLKTTSTDLRILLREMQEMLARALGPQITLCIESPADLPPVQVDANQIELAIMNLVINSRDAMPEGGTITLHASANGAPAREAGKGSYVSVRVTDTGSGMDAQTLAKAVEPFFSTKPLGKGTGLGLSMVHGLAAQLGGALELRSEPGKGTEATLWLPMATTPPVEKEAPAVPASATRAATILVVDDDPLIAMSTVDMLQDLGHVAIEAHSGQRALEILDAGQAVDLLLTDQAMPGMTGLELAAIVRSRLPAMPVLLATGYADLQSGKAADLPHLSKPYRQRQLQDAIHRLLG